MKLHTVFVTHNRLELTKKAITSYMDTVSVEFTVMVVDNASTDGTLEWLLNETWLDFLPQAENRYPGHATNRGWRHCADATHLQRADNDFEFLPGWCDEVERIFMAEKVGQVGLRTGTEERSSINVGGNCVIRRELWDRGLRYAENPWTDWDFYEPGWSEDSLLSQQVRQMGYTWTRVRKPCIVSLASGDWNDEYYQRSYGDRRIEPDPEDPTLPGTS